MKIFAHKECKIAVAEKVFYHFFFFNLFIPFKHLFAPTSKSNVQTFWIFGILGEK